MKKRSEQGGITISTLLDDAIIFAVNAHSGMQRKRSSVPYILHPMEVAAIVGTMTGDEEVIAAAMLHDTVEDTPVTAEQILERFGPRVAELVASETEDKRPGIPPSESWRIRKEESLDVLRRSTDRDVKILWLADKLSNMRSFFRAWRIKGNAVWNDFNQKDPVLQAWYYRSISELLSELKGYEAWQEYDTLVNMVFEGVS